MTALLTSNLPLLAGAPNGIKKLRELILELAIRGKLVPQDPSDEPANMLLKRIAEEKARLLAEGKIKRPKPLGDIAEAEMPFGLPEGWCWTSLTEIAAMRGGSTPSMSKPEFWDGDIPWVSPKDMHDGDITDSELKVTQLALEKTSLELVPIGSILLVGRSGILKRKLPVQITAVPCTINQDLKAISPFQPQPSNYLQLFLRGTERLILQEDVKQGTTVQSLVYEKLFARPFGLPPLTEQHRIIAKVDTLMALCDRLEAQQADAESAHAQLVQALLDSLAQASHAVDFAVSWQRLAEHFHTLFTTEPSIDALKHTLLQLAVMGKLVPQDPNDESASELLKRITEEKAQLVAAGKLKKQKLLAEIAEDEKSFELATGWEWSRLGDQVIESGAGWSPSCEPRPREGSDWGVLKVSAVSWGVYRPEENKALPVSLDARPEHEVAEGDFLVSRANTAELVARSVVVDATPNRLMLSDKIVRLKLTNLCNRHYVNLMNSATYARKYYARVAGGTSSSMKNVSREQILSLPIALPPLKEQYRIVALVDQLMALCEQLKIRLTQARQLNEQLASTLVEQAVA
ncbi:restriction endonuclease subunit S [Perlucidibaca aquatica]|uniref:restriction endonuclease subunit S n=1 Tax=Perlucidibaca aquatica TaxID=1852776 RepID=UPI000839FEB6|nr:restriction endonuclease subunit S [Perlucidibaca aquatica]